MTVNTRDLPEKDGLAWIQAAQEPMEALRRTIAWLRCDQGCPWDRKQTHSTLKRYAIEESHELADAVDTGDPAKIREELGDLLLQVVLHAQIGAETGAFDLDGVARGITEKLLRRHPHVFGDAVAETPEAVLETWEKTKEKEREGRPEGLLDGVPRHLPALARANRLAERAARVGFDWPDIAPVLGKLKEEIRELEEEMARETPVPERLSAELGDVLFAAANLGRHLGLEPEESLQQTNTRFTNRFRHIEARLTEQGLTPSQATLEQMDVLWEEAKKK